MLYFPPAGKQNDRVCKFNSEKAAPDLRRLKLYLDYSDSPAHCSLLSDIYDVSPTIVEQTSDQHQELWMSRMPDTFDLTSHTWQEGGAATNIAESD